MRICRAPKVYLIARPQIAEGLEDFLEDLRLEWPTPTEGVTDAERLVEVAGRCCYMSFGKKAGSKTNRRYLQNLLGRDEDGSFKPGPAHGSVCEHPTWSFLIVGAGRGFCYDDQTDVLTLDGWKPWPEVEGTEQFATLETDTGKMTYQFASRLVVNEHDGPMYRVDSKMVDLLVTPEHNMLVRRYPDSRRPQPSWLKMPASELVGKRFQYRTDANWQGIDPGEVIFDDVESEQEVSNACGSYGSRTIICAGRRVSTQVWSRFLGYWIADGHLDGGDGSGYLAVLSHSGNPRKQKAYTAACDELGWSYWDNGLQIRVSCGKAVHRWLSPYMGAENKRIPREVLGWSRDLLRQVVDCYLFGDGSFTERGSGEGWTCSPGLANDLQEAALKAGWSASIREVDRRGESGGVVNGQEIVHRKLSYVVGFRKQNVRPLVNHRGAKSDRWEHYSGKVYCVSVPNGTLYVRRNGKPAWSCNSHEQVRHRVGWAYSQLSTRYCDFERDEEEGTWEPGFCIPPLAQLTESTADRMSEMLEKSQQTYCELLRDIESDLKNNEEFMASLEGYDERERQRMLRKAARGAARDILPIATEAIMTMSANARAIWNCIALRASEHAEAVIRDIYVQIARIMEREMPALFRGLTYRNCWDGSEAVKLPREKL